MKRAIICLFIYAVSSTLFNKFIPISIYYDGTTASIYLLKNGTNLSNVVLVDFVRK